MRILLFLSLISWQILFSQQSPFGIIRDKDGYVNVRSEPNAQSPIKGTIKTGEAVSVYDEDTPWLSVSYDNGKSLEGYVHRSRFQPLNKFPKIPLKYQQKNRIKFANETIEISIGFKQVDLKTERKYITKGKNYGDYQEELYKGKTPYGVDGFGYFHKDKIFTKYENISLKMNGKTIDTPQKELEVIFDVSNDTRLYDCYWDKEKNRVFIETVAGDGAGGVSILFIFENGILKKKLFWKP